MVEKKNKYLVFLGAILTTALGLLIRVLIIWWLQDKTGLPLDFSFGEVLAIVILADFLLQGHRKG